MGVNSTALMLLLEDEGIEFESVFVNHGGDYPETYEYAKYLKDKGFEKTVVVPEVQKSKTIEEYCLKHNIIPMRQLRWCSDKFKVRVLHKYFQMPCISYVGICAGEEKRINNHISKKKINTQYPLVEKGIDRARCITIIREHGLTVPKKSGCWLCPFMRKLEVRELLLNYPELYARRKKLEKAVVPKKKPIYLSYDTPIEVIAMESTPPIDRWLEK